MRNTGTARRAGPRDDADRRLLALLLANARQTTLGLARQLGLGRATVHERIQRLERDGVIRGYTVLLAGDPGEERAQAVVLLAIAQRAQRQVVEALGRFPEVRQCLAINGEYDLLLAIEAPRNEDLDALIDEIAGIRGVERTRSQIVLSVKFDRRGVLAAPAD